MNYKNNLKKLNPKHTEVSYFESSNCTSVRLERPHPFIKEPLTNITPEGEEEKFTIKQYVRFNIQNESQEIKSIITQEQKEIIQAILHKPNSHALELLIDRLFEIQQDYETKSHIPEVNYLSGLTSILLSYGLQEDYINQAFENNHSLEQAVIITFHFYLFQILLKTTKHLSQCIYKVSKNYQYAKSKDSNQ
ncbi:hypothetical protein HOJ01_00345 [bacterium]|jgi:hypothetical protein|nr:hypothetical protein [bacterium]MBT6293237.1 hypothetical protein [bacterium]